MSPHALPVPLGDYDLGNCNFRRANGLIEKSVRQWLWIISFELGRAAKAARFGSRFTACGGRLIAFGGGIMWSSRKRAPTRSARSASNIAACEFRSAGEIWNRRADAATATYRMHCRSVVAPAWQGGRSGG